MEYLENFKGQSVWIDKIKCFLVANEENKEILFKLLPNIFQEITNFNEVKPVKRVLSNRKKSK
jgi:Zn-finger protein